MRKELYLALCMVVVRAGAADFARGSFEEGYGVSLYVTPEGELCTVGEDWDLNDDGYLDLVAVNEFDISFGKQIHDTYSYVFWGSETGFVRSRCDSFPTHGAECAALADFDRDGWADIVIANSTCPYSYVIYGSSAGYTDARRDSFQARANHGSVSVADLNRDGWLDLVWSNWSAAGDGYSSIYWGGGEGFGESRTDSLPTGPAHGNLVADFDADGWADIFWAVYYARDDSLRRPSRIFWGGQNGFTASDYTELASVGPGDDVSVGDLDRDGFLDIVVPNHSSKPPPGWGSYGYSYVHYGLGSRMFRLDSLRADAPWGASVADVNADGWLDVAFAGSQSLLYYGSSKGFGSPQVIPMRFTSSVTLADFDRDGLCDVALGRQLVTMLLLKVFYQRGFLWEAASLDPGGMDAGVTKDLGNPSTKRDEAFWISAPTTVVTASDSVATLASFALDSRTTWHSNSLACDADVELWVSASPDAQGLNWGPWIKIEGEGPYPVSGRTFRSKLRLRTDFRTSLIIRDVELGFRIEGLPDSLRITSGNGRMFDVWLPSSALGSSCQAEIYDGSGRRVRGLRPDRLGHVYWLGEDEMGQRLPRGVYFLLVKGDGMSVSEKLVLLD